MKNLKDMIRDETQEIVDDIENAVRNDERKQTLKEIQQEMLMIEHDSKIDSDKMFDYLKERLDELL